MGQHQAADQEAVVAPALLQRDADVDDLDPQCALPGLVLNQPRPVARVDTILNNSFGMLGINSTLIVRRFAP